MVTIGVAIRIGLRSYIYKKKKKKIIQPEFNM